MALVLYQHPLASFCHKVLIALYENGTPFEPRLIERAAADEHARFLDLWPVGKMPVLRDEARDATVPETSIIIEYLDRHYPGPLPLLPADPTANLDARLWDRFFDLYVSVPMQKIVLDRLRGEGEHDPRGVADAHASLGIAYGMLEHRMSGRLWAAGDSFGLADCSAAPALFYAGIVTPFGEGFPNLSAYFERLLQRPSYARVLAEARPYFKLFPYYERMPVRFLAED
ncbi:MULTISPECIES: glutathione S-transferase family protein [unclassified Lysobacter]|uniref:glutathione S-transferase family protein n=1 Tax=unclassified Lysobacter TaxID=2635362 RepID=UPI0006F7D007|nr:MULTISPECIES: glutathione S-transferase family protein [unclassified Lysobacter]KQZ56497.1 glutathione S-transferase [Lysobacter sp. Root559]KRC35059.1 glutathione S-transferase [Lysobacter sp. Root76]KRD70748.1 glutathione S-transferase [Lysobacter sp. Root96]